MSKEVAETPEYAYLEKLKSLAQEAAKSENVVFTLPEAAFSTYIDYKSMESLIYHDTLQVYDELIDRSVAHARNSYFARAAAAKALFDRGVVINNETISGVISGELAYIRAQAEVFLWNTIASCPIALNVTGGKNAVLTTIPLARFVILHLSERDLCYGDEEYLLVKKSKDNEEGSKESHRVDFDGKMLIAGSVSAISKK